MKIYVIAQPPLLKSPSEHRGQGHSSSFEAFILTRIVARFQTRSFSAAQLQKVRDIAVFLCYRRLEWCE